MVALTRLFLWCSSERGVKPGTVARTGRPTTSRWREVAMRKSFQVAVWTSMSKALLGIAGASKRNLLGFEFLLAIQGRKRVADSARPLSPCDFITTVRSYRFSNRWEPEDSHFTVGDILAASRCLLCSPNVCEALWVSDLTTKLDCSKRESYSRRASIAGRRYYQLLWRVQFLRSKAWVHRFALQCEHTKDTLVNPIQRFVCHEALQGLKTK